MPLMWQTLTFAALFTCSLVTTHQQIPKQTLCLEEPARVRRLRAFAIGAHRNSKRCPNDAPNDTTHVSARA